MTTNIDEGNVKKKKLIESMLLALFPCFTICVYAPLSIYCVNATEFWYSLRVIWYIPLLTFCILFTLGTFILCITSGTIRSIFMGLIFGVGLCFYIQGNFLNIHLGQLNGQYIDWDAYRGKMYLNVCIWILIILVSVFLFVYKLQLLSKVSQFLSAVLTLMQLVSLTVFLVSTVNSQGFSIPYVPTYTTEGLFEVGDENIIVIIVDTLDELYADYALKELPECKDYFDGFQYYDNFTSEYRQTNFSYACDFVLNERYYLEKPLDEWVEEKSDKRLYFDELKEHGYEISLYTDMVKYTPSRVREMATNYVELPMHFYNLRTAFSVLYRYAGCTYFPDIFKPYIWMDDTFISKTAITDGEYTCYDYSNNFFKYHLDRNDVSVKTGTKQFKIIHIYGVHQPIYIDEWGNDGPQTWDSTIGTKGSLRIVFEYLDKLKAAGVYDDSTIIITGDHGEHNTLGILSNPAFFIKCKNAHGNVLTNSCEAGLVNFAATIADIAGADDTSQYGLSLFDIDENTRFKRYCFGRVLKKDGFSTSNGLLEYVVPCETNDTNRYIMTGIEYATGGKKINHYDYCEACQKKLPHEYDTTNIGSWVVDKHWHVFNYDIFDTF